MLNKHDTDQFATAKLIKQGRYADAESLLLRVLVERPDDVQSLLHLGIVYRATSRLLAAEGCYRRAIVVSPNTPELHSNLANTLVDLDRYDEAIVCARHAVKLDESSVLFRKNLAAALREAKQFEEAAEHFRQCLKQTPDDHQLQLSLAIALLYLRQLEEGWDRFDCRFQAETKEASTTASIPRWEGEDLTGKRLLLTAEQGFGDTMLMTRFIPDFIARGAKLSLACRPPLHRIFSQLPVTLLMESDVKSASYDYHAPLMHLPKYLGRDWLQWPAAIPFHVPTTARQKYAFISQVTPDRLRVGIVWSGSEAYRGNAKRAADYQYFLRLSAQLPQIQFYSFQKGPGEQDLATHGAGTILPMGQSFEGFEDTAAAAEQMDLILMTDSALVHLAGGLGMPVLDLLQFVPYWLYFPETATTPLYPSVRFLRQQSPGDWRSVFESVTKVLTGLSKARQQGQLSRHQVTELLTKW